LDGAGGRQQQLRLVEEALAHVVMEEKAPMDMMDALRFRQDRSDEILSLEDCICEHDNY